MPKEHGVRTKIKSCWQTPLPSLLQVSHSPMYNPCQWRALGPYPSQLAPSQSTLPSGSGSGFGPLCQILSFALGQSALTRVFCLWFETKPMPGIHLELEMYFPSNAQMSVQSKSAPRQLTHLNKGTMSSSHTHSKRYTLLETSAFKTTCLVISKHGKSFELVLHETKYWGYDACPTDDPSLWAHTHIKAHPSLKWDHRVEEYALMWRLKPF